MITRNVKLYLTGGFPVRIPVSQFDTAWQFVFTIIKDSVTWTIPSGASAVLNGLKPDGNVFAFAGTISGNTVTVNCDVQMTACAGDTICELSIFATEGSEESQRANVVGTANFVLAVEAAPNSTGATPSASDLDAYGAIISDELDTYFEQHPEMIEGKGLSEPIRLAILDCFQHVAWGDAHGQDYYDALYALLMNKEILSITAVFEQGSAVIYDTDTLDTLKQYLTVTANYDDGTSAVVTTYTLAGELTAGTSTITVSYADKTTTFNVVVSSLPYLYKMSTGDIVKSVGTISGTVGQLIYIATNNQNRRLFALQNGKIKLKQGNGSTYTDSDYYPFPVPKNATKVTVSITPNTQYFNISRATYDTTDLMYKKDGETGWKLGSTEYALDAGENRFICINGKYNSGGTAYQVEPTELIVEFSDQ